MCTVEGWLSTTERLEDPIARPGDIGAAAGTDRLSQPGDGNEQVSEHDCYEPTNSRSLHLIDPTVAVYDLVESRQHCHMLATAIVRRGFLALRDPADFRMPKHGPTFRGNRKCNIACGGISPHLS